MQFGFMPGEGTVDAIFILRRTEEEYQKKQKNIKVKECCMLVDYLHMLRKKIMEGINFAMLMIIQNTWHEIACYLDCHE